MNLLKKLWNIAFNKRKLLFMMKRDEYFYVYNTRANSFFKEKFYSLEKSLAHPNKMYLRCVLGFYKINVSDMYKDYAMDNDKGYNFIIATTLKRVVELSKNRIQNNTLPKKSLKKPKYQKFITAFKLISEYF